MQGDSIQLPCYAASTQHPPLQHISSEDAFATEMKQVSWNASILSYLCSVKLPY
jgi:hypothetical protein